MLAPVAHIDRGGGREGRKCDNRGRDVEGATGAALNGLGGQCDQTG